MWTLKRRKLTTFGVFFVCWVAATFGWFPFDCIIYVRVRVRETVSELLKCSDVFRSRPITAHTVRLLVCTEFMLGIDWFNGKTNPNWYLDGYSNDYAMALYVSFWIRFERCLGSDIWAFAFTFHEFYEFCNLKLRKSHEKCTYQLN